MEAGLSAGLRELTQHVAARLRTGAWAKGIAASSAESRSPGKAEQSFLFESAYDLYKRQGKPLTRTIDEVARCGHLHRLSGANQGSGTWLPDWRIVDVSNDGVVEVERDGVSFFVSPRDIRSAEAGLQVGNECCVRIPKERLRFLPGFYLGFGDAEKAARGSQDYWVRLYWHLDPDGAVSWVRELTDRFNRQGIPFIFKVLADPQEYSRADAGILWLEPRYLESAFPVIQAIHTSIAHTLRREVPLLTLPLADGLSVAEGPPDGSSFGEHRCQIVVESVLESFRNGRNSTREVTAAVTAAFRSRGLDPFRPYLAPGSTTEYRSFPRPMTARATPTKLPCERGSRRFDEVACELGDVLCDEAIWYEEQCNWIGQVVNEETPDHGGVLPTSAALNADLYGGTAGVGLFLSELFTVSRDECHRRTAIGAVHQALAAIERNGGSYRPLSFLAGDLGVAWSALRVAALTGDEATATTASKLLSTCLSRVRSEQRLLEFVRGSAGAILLLLDLHNALGEARFLDSAVPLGDEILAAATHDEEAVSWPNKHVNSIALENPPLTGLSHGAAGIGVALFELYRTTKRSDYLSFARAAFSYEDAEFDHRRCNWPDYRRSRSADEADFRIAWCHGAPGIALSRLRAMRVDSARLRGHEQVARKALTTTVRALRKRSVERSPDLSLCHGLCGLIETTFLGGLVLNEREHCVSAKEAMSRIVASCVRRGHWPSGVPSRGKNPSLFLGTAGVGHCLLFLQQPAAVRFVLLPTIELDQVQSPPPASS